MKEFNFRKIGILAVIMLVGALVLVGPASAYSQVYTDHYRFRVGVTSGSPAAYWASVNTLDYTDAELICITIVFYDQYGNYLGHVSDCGWDTISLTVQGYYPDPVPGSYAEASFDSVNPNDSYYGLICYLY